MDTAFDLSPGPDESLDLLAGHWKIFQLKKGHRFSTDDLAVAWRAAVNCPNIDRMLDIGCGIGSVGLSTLHRLKRPEVRLTGVEAQETSAAMAVRTVRFNGLQDRVSIVRGDLRDPAVLPEGVKFPLITGSPPYIPEGKGLLSPFPQRAACRIELRGSVFDYCAAARRWLEPHGRFVYVMVAADPRTEAAPGANGLVILERWNFVFRGGRPAHICTIVCAREEDGPFPPRREGELVIRNPEGEWTEEYFRFRAEMGADSLVSRSAEPA